jgi:hypothetical protein
MYFHRFFLLYFLITIIRKIYNTMSLKLRLGIRSVKIHFAIDQFGQSV